MTTREQDSVEENELWTKAFAEALGEYIGQETPVLVTPPYVLIDWAPGVARYWVPETLKPFSKRGSAPIRLRTVPKGAPPAPFGVRDAREDHDRLRIEGER
jgi:hypothetical protein